MLKLCLLLWRLSREKTRLVILRNAQTKDTRQKSKPVLPATILFGLPPRPSLYPLSLKFLD